MSQVKPRFALSHATANTTHPSKIHRYREVSSHDTTRKTEYKRRCPGSTHTRGQICATGATRPSPQHYSTPYRRETERSKEHPKQKPFNIAPHCLLVALALLGKNADFDLG
ncbi:hypothetical protein CRENBAI_024406 [Crenichthys baileyi]|uniref:Uncharacterized protein n=1 Tax=Crenichthys baileyi TaxID=28760 RepID=A0AAV9RBF2_9TELE